MNVALPKSIQAEMDKAEALERELAAQAHPQEEVQTEPEVTESVDIAVEAEKLQQAESTTAQVQPAQEPEVDWERRFATIQGKYNAEVPRLYEQLKQQNQQMHELSRELEALRAPTTEGLSVEKPVVTAQDEDAFGEDLIDLARRIAREEANRCVAEALDKVEREITPLREQVGNVHKTQTLSSQERYWAELDKRVPDWEQINTDQRWLTWLAEYDPIAGATRQEALDRASSSLDVARTVAFFSLWKNQNVKVAEIPAAPANQELLRQVAPTKTKASSAPAGDRLWTPAEYEAAYDHRNYVGKTDKEITAMQTEADRAHQEGRVRW